MSAFAAGFRPVEKPVRRFYNAVVMSDHKPRNRGEIERIVIVGVGLIGGSVAAAVRKRQLAGVITGCGRSLERLEAARRHGLIDEATTDLPAAARQSDLVVVCTPVDLIVPFVREAAAHSGPGTLVTDAGSVKGSICRELATGPEASRFIGSHPMAGSERQGFEHSDADLFEGRVTIVTPLEGARPDAVNRLKSFWRSLGSVVVELSPEEHDRAVAQISHVPHVAAAALTGLLGDANRGLAATGFRDTTRVASGDPELWRPILMSNRDEVVRGLDIFADGLAGFRRAIVDGDEDALKKLLQQAKSKRDALG